MTEIALRGDTPTAVVPVQQNDAIAELARWAQAADAAYQMAGKLVTTQFVPQHYRGKPAEATAAILAGAEVGLSPMAALRAFDNIQGTPAPKAITLRAIVQAQGHKVRIVESTAVKAVVAVRRRDEDEWQTCEWTIEQATQAGFPAKNPNWKSNPKAMLVARATAEGCRWIASDAIMGMPYSSEEIQDQVAFDRQPRVTAADILGDTGPVQAEVVLTPPAGISREQQQRMTDLFAAKGIDGRKLRLEYVAEKVGRPVKAAADLTADEGDMVIVALEELPDLPADEPAGIGGDEGAEA